MCTIRTIRGFYIICIREEKREEENKKCGNYGSISRRVYWHVGWVYSNWILKRRNYRMIFIGFRYMIGLYLCRYSIIFSASIILWFPRHVQSSFWCKWFPVDLLAGVSLLVKCSSCETVVNHSSYRTYVSQVRQRWGYRSFIQLLRNRITVSR